MNDGVNGECEPLSPAGTDATRRSISPRIRASPADYPVYGTASQPAVTGVPRPTAVSGAVVSKKSAKETLYVPFGPGETFRGLGPISAFRILHRDPLIRLKSGRREPLRDGAARGRRDPGEGPSGEEPG